MAQSSLTRAQAGDHRSFEELVAPHRRELQLHCYRMLGSLQDAEDALQETLVAAWRSLDRFEQRASLRAWLYRIATNRCLNFKRDSARRPRSAPLPFDVPPPTRLNEITWLEPYPDLFIDETPGPEARLETREAVGLAFVTALQRLPARQRAALVLRDVLGFRAAEAAEILDTTEPTVNSALNRARSALGARRPVVREHAPAPRSPHERELAARFADAFERGDLDGVVAMLTDDALVTMPPAPLEYEGREAIAEFFRHVTDNRAPGRRARLVPTRANGQPAFGHYIAQPDAATAAATGVLVLAVEGDGIAAIARFEGAELVARFGLPPEVDV